MTADLPDPQVNGTFAVRPERVVALSGADVSGSPTWWTFPGARAGGLAGYVAVANVHQAKTNR